MKRSLIENMDWRGERDFSLLPFNEVDALIFSVLIYQRFEDAPQELEGKTIDELYPILCPVPPELTKGFDTARFRLWEKVASSRRFSSLRLDFFSSSLSKEEKSEEQFAAAVFSSSDGRGYMIFRGTDESVTGWQEDLNLACEDEIPSERKALEFLSSYSEGYTSLVLAGHSKGGTNAIYAALRAENVIFRKIEKIYSFDAPGLARSLTLSPRWEEVTAKTESFVPSTSIVGMLFNTAEKQRVVRADGIAIMQHDPFTWWTEKESFVYEKDLSVVSRLHSESMEAFLSSTTREERAILVSVISRVLASVKEENIFRIPFVIFERFDLFNNELLSLTDEEKRIVKKLFRAYMASSRKGYKRLRDNSSGRKEDK